MSVISNYKKKNKDFILKHGDCVDILPDIPSNIIDLCITSPPYDDIKNYNNTLSWDFNIFKTIAKQLYRVVKDGGVLVWVVNDQTKKGTKTGTSFNQALYFKEIGFNLHDVMIFAKNNPMPQIFHKRYTDAFEYMFILSKGKPNTCNALLEPCKNAGKKCSPVKQISSDDKVVRKDKNNKIKDYKIKSNIWYYSVGGKNYGHPAVFPLDLAKDHILTWTNEDDLVLDPLMGSGTVGVACKELKRKFIGIEKVDKYFNIALSRCGD